MLTALGQGSPDHHPNTGPPDWLFRIDINKSAGSPICTVTDCRAAAGAARPARAACHVER